MGWLSHTGQRQPLGSAANAVPGATSPSGSPYAGSYSLPQAAHDQVAERSSTGGCGDSGGNASEGGGSPSSR